MKMSESTNEDTNNLKRAVSSIKDIKCHVNISQYVEIIQDYIQKKNNSLTTSTHNDIKRPELVLASRSSENPISVIDRTADSIYRINIKRINPISHNIIQDTTNVSYEPKKDSSVIYSPVSHSSISTLKLDDAPSPDEIYLTITLHDTNDVLQMEHNIRYHIDTVDDKLFKQILSGIFVNPIY